LEAAISSVKLFSDKRFQHVYDHEQIAGKEIANSIGWDGHVAWDIYLFYEPHTNWHNIPPKPTYWMHQLPDSWADREHYHTGEDLVKEFVMTMKSLIA